MVGSIACAHLHAFMVGSITLQSRCTQSQTASHDRNGFVYFYVLFFVTLGVHIMRKQFGTILCLVCGESRRTSHMPVPVYVFLCLVCDESRRTYHASSCICIFMSCLWRMKAYLSYGRRPASLDAEIPTIIDPSATRNYPSATGSIIVGISVSSLIFNVSLF